MGMNDPRAFAAMITPLYPATVLMEVRASMGWVLLIRGMPSRVKLTTPCAARSRTIGWLAGDAGWRKATIAWPRLIIATS